MRNPGDGDSVGHRISLNCVQEARLPAGGQGTAWGPPENAEGAVRRGEQLPPDRLEALGKDNGLFIYLLSIASFRSLHSSNNFWRKWMSFQIKALFTPWCSVLEGSPTSNCGAPAGFRKEAFWGVRAGTPASALISRRPVLWVACIFTLQGRGRLALGPFNNAAVNCAFQPRQAFLGDLQEMTRYPEAWDL